MSYFEFLKSFSLPFYIVLIITALFFGWGAVTLLTANRDPSKIIRGNKILLWTIIGFFGFTVAFLIFTFGSNFLKNNNIFNKKDTNIINPEGFPPAPYEAEFPPFEN